MDKKSRNAVQLSLVIVLLLVLACGGAGKTAPADYETCSGFLDVSDVERITSEPEIEVKTEVYPRGSYSEKFPTRTDCHFVFESGSRGINVRAMRYGSAAEAAEPYESMVTVFRRNVAEDEGRLEQFREGVVGENSMQVMGWSWDLPHISPYVMFRSGRDVVTLQDNASGGGPLVTEVDVMVELASLIESRIR